MLYKIQQRESVDPIEYQLPDGWPAMLQDQPSKLELMKRCDPKKELTIKLGNLEELIGEG